VITKALGVDAIGISNANHIWVDHCDLSSDRDHGSDYYDGLVDITHGSENITVSWTRFHDHFRSSQIGHSDSASAATEDTGKLTVTFHHNLFSGTASHNPSLRFGTVHAFNNYFINIDNSGISSRMGGRVLAEENYFDMATRPLTTHYESPMDGFITDLRNHFENSAPIEIGASTSWTPTYTYADAKDAVLSVPAIVSACAGTGKVP
jgi:pectate lyase